MRGIVASLFLVGCAPYPYVNYYDLDKAIANAETKEEADYYEERLESWEDQTVKAGVWLDQWQGCQANPDCISVCDFKGMTPMTRGTDPEKNKVHEGIPELVRWYQYTRPPTCGFTGRERR